MPLPIVPDPTTPIISDILTDHFWLKEKGRFVIYHLTSVNSTYKCNGGIAFFAPAERDVYSYQRAHNVFAPLGAKPVSETTAEHATAIALQRSAGGKKKLHAINISPRWGEEATILCRTSKLKFADDKWINLFF
jgi:hypothetical protein